MCEATGRQRPYPEMPRQERAKQFQPFAALKGYAEALRKKERIIVPKKELSQEYLEALEDKVRRLKKNDMVTAVFYCGGEYIEQTGMVSRIDGEARLLRLVHTEIPFDCLLDVRKAF